ncbi:hypothetical protein F5Y03DRAFT_361564 [Xylaria venustula]|nr:hypothetical protein F5Y03DRAFT_361564 [Xylaria venustula]
MANNNQRSGKRPVVGEGSERHWDTSSQKILQDLKKVEGRLLPRIAAIPELAKEVYDAGEKTMREERPPRSHQDLLDMLPTVTIDNVWTQEKEDSFQEAFAADPYRRLLESAEAHPTKSNHNYMTMWKSITQVCNCFPSDIVGVKSHTEYGVDVDVGNGVMKPDPRWSLGFCERLTQLALGSVHRRSSNYLPDLALTSPTKTR